MRLPLRRGGGAEPAWRAPPRGAAVTRRPHPAKAPGAAGHGVGTSDGNEELLPPWPHGQPTPGPLGLKMDKSPNPRGSRSAGEDEGKR